MPELPEVETVRNTLKKQILGETITKVEIFYGKMLYPNEEAFYKLINQTFIDIKRYGKYLFFILNDYIIISHLRMEGKFFIKTNAPIEKHEHIVFTLNSGRTLRYHDTRKFGIMKLLETNDFNKALQEPEIKKLGMEANSPSLTGKILYEKLKNKKVPIKTALLDQENICGLGNIYVDEVCYLSNIHPLTLAENITIEDANKIVDNSKKVLEKAILAGGTTIRSYTSSLGVTGLFQLELHVHTKVGKPCEKCGTIIKKIKVGGRGTYYCPNCQVKKPTIIGITGGIASGKSAVFNYLKSEYIDDIIYIDCDEISHELLTKEKVISEICEKIGIERDERGKISRQELGGIVFNNEEKLKLLNEIMHPLVKKEILDTISKNGDKKIIFVDIPLLIETKMENLVDEIWLIYVDKQTQIARLKSRDHINDEMAQQKINAQMDIDEKLDYLKKIDNKLIINNENTLKETYHLIDQEMNRRKIKKCH